MIIRDSLRGRLRAGPPLVLDSAMGTELARRGAWTELPLWSARALLDAPQLVAAIHADEVAAGADALTANTFRTHRRSLAKEGLGARSAELTRLAVSFAREAARRSRSRVWVLGSLSPLEDCYRPELVADDASLAREHEEQARAIAGAGADGILVETHNTARELAAAARAARATGLPVIASLISDGSGRLLSGEPIAAAVAALGASAADALSINCVPARLLAGDLGTLGRAAPGAPLGAYGNLGPPTDPEGTRFAQEIAPEDYAALARSWIRLGARMVGGCCGTTAGHTAALRQMLDADPQFFT